MSAIDLLQESSADTSATRDSAAITGSGSATKEQINKAAYQIYQNLTKVSVTPAACTQSKTFLQKQLAEAARLSYETRCEIPHDSSELRAWMELSAEQVGEAYAAYLNERKQGHARRYFQTRSAALTYLQNIAPTKLVDGAWLYGALSHWQDARFKPLIKTYLEELGDGDPAFNHVLLYKRLLSSCDCETDINGLKLDNTLYRQGAIQLALAHHAEEFLPEVIGYNLGYEKLPLHLLITAYELKELGIDPYYFTLHVTTDNASTGHAQKAVEVIHALSSSGGGNAFFNRVRAGYRLNELGPGAEEIVNTFDLQQQVITMLQNKSHFGKNMHSDYCRIGGRPVNQWLAQPECISDFLKALEKYGWIKRHDDPDKSRFWSLIEGDKPRMFGVFSSYETQLLYDWIAGDWLETRLRWSSYRHRNSYCDGQAVLENNLDTAEEKSFKENLMRLSTPEQAQKLIERMSPAMHDTPEGLLATRLYKDFYNNGAGS